MTTGELVSPPFILKAVSEKSLYAEMQAFLNFTLPLYITSSPSSGWMSKFFIVFCEICFFRERDSINFKKLKGDGSYFWNFDTFCKFFCHFSIRKNKCYLFHSFRVTFGGVWGSLKKDVGCFARIIISSERLFKTLFSPDRYPFLRFTWIFFSQKYDGSSWNRVLMVFQ